MTSRITDYDSSITEPSRRELISIAHWIQENGQRTFLVGGWAVFYHTTFSGRPAAKYGAAAYRKSHYRDFVGFAPLGSKDIDLVFENKKARETFEQKYCRNNGYVPPSRLRERSWTKPSSGTEILLDFDLLSNHRTVRRTKIGWTNLLEHQVAVEVDGNVSIPAPAKELLLLYKCVALVERTDQRGLPNQDLKYLDSKIWKDANDILALHETGIDAGLLSAISKESGTEKILVAAKQIIASNFDSYGLTHYSKSRRFLHE